MNTSADATNTLIGPAVVGLDGGRKAAHRQQRHRRRRDRVRSLLMMAVLVAAIGGAGYVGYQVYLDYQDREAAESERIRAELDANRGDPIQDTLDDVQNGPRWNGPGAPAFGVGDDPTAEIVVIEP